MHIDWWTLALQALNFLVLVWLLWRFLYKPVKTVIAARKALAEKAFADAAAAKEAAETARRSLEEARAGLAQEREDLLKKVHQDLEAERGKIIDQAHRAADEVMKSADAAIAKERGQALAEIRGQATDLAANLASALLRQSGVDALNDVFLAQVETKLKSLADDERDRLRKDLDGGGAHLTVVTAAPLAPADQKHWRARLAACLDRAGEADFAVDAGILGGAELRFPHAVLKFTWADQLEQAKGVLGRDEAAS